MKIAIITGSRADWNGLGMVGKALCERAIDVRVIAIGQHADSEESLKTIIADGFDPKLLRTNTKEDMAIGCGRAAIAVSGALAAERPDLVLLCGDRFEILGAASAAALCKVPIAHIGGGDVTEGSIDDRLRYAISALADLHFVTNEDAIGRLRARLAPGARIALTGNPALDRYNCTDYVPREAFFREIGLEESPLNILVAYHAETRADEPAAGCRAMIEALSQLKNASFLIIGTNADSGASVIGYRLAQFADLMPRAVLHENLRPDLFFSALEHCTCMVGNSSAGIIETAWSGIPVVNIGDRQKGRPQPDNVCNCAADATMIESAMQSALGSTRVRRYNPYGDGNSAPRIANIIVNHLFAANRSG